MPLESGSVLTGHRIGALPYLGVWERAEKIAGSNACARVLQHLSSGISADVWGVGRIICAGPDEAKQTAASSRRLGDMKPWWEATVDDGEIGPDPEI